jgi:hypothetical protein
LFLDNFSETGSRKGATKPSGGREEEPPAEEPIEIWMDRWIGMDVM